MPSGAKKRKAAKKKKEKEANINPSTNNPQGNDDLKSLDEKGSDGGEVSSPAHHDEDDQHHPFNEGSEEVEEGGPSAGQPSVSDVKSLEEVPSDSTSAEVVGEQEDSVVKIESDLKSGQSSDGINDSVEHVESAKESCYGNGNSSVTSIVKSLPSDSTSAEVVGGQEDSVVKIENDLKSGESSDRINDSHIESAKESCYGNGNSSKTSIVKSLDESNSKDEPYNSKQETITSEDLTNSVYSSSTKMTLTTENAPVEETGNLVVEPCINSAKEVASVLEVKSSDDGSALVEKSVVSQVAETDLAMKKKEDKVFPLSDHHVRTPDSDGSKLKEYDGKVSASLSDSPVTESTKGAEHSKDLETPECSENQPQVVSAPHMMQKTSWLSCCGLFEVLSGCGR